MSEVINLKKTAVLFLMILLNVGIVFSDADEFEEAKKLIDAKTPCSKLTENQLEAMGDYYMEQMHPGEAHELMDEMMGGEGSESLKQMHIAMAKRIYCNDISGMTQYGMMGSGGMMGMMPMMMSMMGAGMMGTGKGTNYGGTGNMMYNIGYGMMGSGFGYWGFLNFLSLVLVIGLIILVYLWIIKLWRELPKKKQGK